MRIRLDKLEAMGVKYNLDEKEKTLTFFSEFYNTAAHKKLVDVAESLEFSDAECEELVGAAYKIQMVSTLKRASGG